MAVADVYDALVCKRVYKGRLTHAEAVETIVADSGRHFEPEVVAAFLAVNEEFLHISQMFAEEPVFVADAAEAAEGRSFGCALSRSGVLGRAAFCVKYFIGSR
ncbi:hypothetical protein LPW11_00015 [Geomonas sp. RF6]|uniref:hypothetical protein n=1 Tax=Geomonas sp. RF6 TaxID=2897342 RepID=UPI001E47F88C|nr:hypothetical protein [Geomonas sp. RF6]UFS70595.1 hypothetical protein LPW11_00015 [Geomonas sp. RF6]